MTEPIWFHVSGDFSFSPEDGRAQPLLEPVKSFFDEVVGNGSWLQAVPDAEHFAVKFPRHALNVKTSEFRVKRTEASSSNVSVICLEHIQIEQPIFLQVNVDEFMRHRGLGCYTPLPIVWLTPPAPVPLSS